MNDDFVISISIPPFPIFIEGNFTEYNVGALHPERKHLEYFNLIFVKEGTLYLGEEGIDYAVGKNEMLVLLPNQHHYPVKPTDEVTKFYWFHFYTTGNYIQSTQVQQLESNISIPSVHFHNSYHTTYLYKKSPLIDTEEIYEKIQNLLEATVKENSNFTFWDTQQQFFSLLNLLNGQNHAKDRSVIIAEKVEQFIREHYQDDITNETLVTKFNLHENTIAKYLKQYYDYTPMEYLKEYRLQQARDFLVKTDYPIQEIAERCGYKWVPYFSRLFKKRFHISPLKYRKSHMETKE
ncbi:AraC family transcriptional regulator [Oceanobacillus sp. Castelsardo]|uniref:helix-turn-helix transcriptional regulator n=1 Tax=Oceanobacillus sp. Castelsardo TaxID=1851204 RepID=UPI0008382293|nr:AraC family transcriptional regulator [Oceanobacillus sp. Castelsardo]